MSDYRHEDELLGRLISFPHRLDDLSLCETDFLWPENRRLFRFIAQCRQTEPAVIAFLADRDLGVWAYRLEQAAPLTEIGIERLADIVRRKRQSHEWRRNVSRLVSADKSRGRIYG